MLMREGAILPDRIRRLEAMGRSTRRRWDEGSLDTRSTSAMATAALAATVATR
jgi:hypothetical protein